MKILKSPSLAKVIDANEENMAEAFGALYAGWDEALSHSGEDAVWGLTRIPSVMINNATRVRFRDDRADEAIEEIIGKAKARGVPMRWWLGPRTQPTNMGERLEKRGFSHGQLAGMAIELDDLQTPPSGSLLRVERVRDATDLEAWCRVVAEGFAVPQMAADGFGRAFEAGGLDGSDWSLYLAYLDGEAVAASSMYLGAGVAGIYNVASRPAARGNGAGSAVSYAPLRRAQQAGYKIGTLQASTLGYGVYRRLGFKEVCRFDLYVEERGRLEISNL